jgi:peptidyl-prolyl cis-trans isomerase D
MLQLIRDRSQGLVVGVIVFFICLTFALFGVQQYLDARGAVVVAEVNGEEIGLGEYQRAFQQIRQRAQAMLGESFDSGQWSGEQAKMSTLDYVVNEKLLGQVVDKSNIRASDAQIANYIRTSPQFSTDGEFSEVLYGQLVRRLGFSTVGFEHQVRKDLVVNQLRAGIGATAFVTSEELHRIEQFRQQSRDVGFAILGIESFRQDSPPSATELDTYFQEHLEDYRVEERVALAYLDLSIESMMAEVVVTEDYLKTYYETNRAGYTKQEQRNANHILIKVAKDAGAQEIENALNKAKELRDSAEKGSEFETLARENSEDIGSKMDGGETGFFGRDVMAPEFEAAVFAMSEGDISAPVRTEFGFHIIRLKAISPGGVKSFSEARSDVQSSYRREQAEALFFEQAEQLSDLAYEHPESLEIAADTLSLAIKSTELVGRGELSDLFSDRVMQAAFEPEILIEGLNSEPIDVTNSRIVVIRIAEHRPTSVPEIGTIIESVTKDLADDRARDAIRVHGELLVERLNNGEDLDAVITAEELRWERVDGATRDSSKLNRAILRTAFRSKPGAADRSAYYGVPIGMGDFGIVGISNAKVPTAKELSISDISQLRREVSAERTAGNWLDFMDLLKSDSKIESFPDRL